ncbi:MAG: hypothetical protein ACTSR8_00830 [Promethearchaeota archaeon]
MSKGFKLLRIEYVFSVIVPCLFAIYLNNYDLTDHLFILAGFGFWAICGNTLNDLKDMDDPNDIETQERTEGYRKKEIGMLSLTAFMLGAACFIDPVQDHPIIFIYLIAIAGMVIIYCVALKPVVVVNWVLLGISHMWFPYFIIKINAGDSIDGLFPIIEVHEWLFLSLGSVMALAGNLIHEMVDKDAITKYPLKTQQIILWSVSITAFALGGISLLFLPEFSIYFLPFLLFPLGILYLGRSQEAIEAHQGKTSLKDVGIIAGNMFFIFVLILIFSS